MKKLITVVLAVALILPAVSMADLPDISGLSFDELVQLKEQINLAIWNSQEWQEVTVPPGIWEIGKDIPAGHWSLRLPEGSEPCYIIYASNTTNDGHDIDISQSIMECLCDPSSIFFDGSYKTETDFDMKEGWFIRLDCTTIFTPYTGKPDLGFK